MNFKDLEFIALEGGGGKGAVYKGAILALEKKMYYQWCMRAINRKNGDGDFIEPTPLDMERINTENPNKLELKTNQPEFDYPSILEYLDKGTETKKIKGIAGSSAGAINAFTLALGLTSKDIDAILNDFQFDKFLSQIDAGKYRMISSKKVNNSGQLITSENRFNIYVGEDKHKKLGAGDGVSEYTFKKDRIAKIKTSPLKWTIRFTIVALFIKIIVSGIFESLKELLMIYKKTEQGILSAQQQNPNDDVLKFFNAMGGLKKSNFSLASTTAVDNFLVWLLKKMFPKNTMLKLINIRTLVNYLFDGGLYSGFIVREFFFNCFLFSLKKDIYCKKEWETFLKKKEISKKDIEDIEIDFTKTDAGFRKCKNITPEKLNQLYKISFKDFHEVTGIDLIFCSTNMTTSEPMYFSKYWTPDFPIIEAVGMSMNIPPAFKPIYNEANVMYQEHDLLQFTNKKGEKIEVIDSKGKFNEQNHNLLILEVMKHIKNKYPEYNQFTTNTSLSFSNYIPILRTLVKENPSNTMERMFLYAYNSAFKGLFIDGGVTNNIPYNAFRIYEKDKNNIDKTLALKVDNNYPVEEQFKLLKLYNEYKKTVSEMIAKQGTVDNLGKIEEIAYSFYSKRFSKLFQEFDADFKIDKIDSIAFDKTISTLKEIDKTINDSFKPWEKRKNAIFGLIDGLMYGMNNGQVRHLNDNNHIVPLYCYGIGTYDFNLKSLKYLTNFSNIRSEKSVNDYLKN